MGNQAKPPRTPNRWQRVSELYHAALARDTGDRDAFLREACAGDDALRREVESLLAHEHAAAPLIETPALEVAARIMNKSPEDGASAWARSIARETRSWVKARMSDEGTSYSVSAASSRVTRKVWRPMLPPPG